ncbi:MAG TPA: ribulose-phosphate 3-epimerase [Calditrichia bacterium]|nr:ribulose-phosphate 3-epimerase [Calditrichia bacterium]
MDEKDVLNSRFKVLPSILAADHGRFLEEVATVDIENIDTVHVDIMDGHFVPNITFGPRVVQSLKQHTRFRLDVHLMIAQVDAYIPQFAAAGADLITIHQEATRHLHRSLTLIAESGAKAGVAINPATPVESLSCILDTVDLVLVMSVNPGFGGQKFIPGALEKIARLARLRQERDYRYVIEVDGGIDAHTAALATAAGAEFLVTGSSVFGAKDRPAAIEAIAEGARNGLRQSRLV